MDKKTETASELHRKFLRDENKKDRKLKKERKKQPKIKSPVLG